MQPADLNRRCAYSHIGSFGIINISLLRISRFSRCSCFFMPSRIPRTVCSASSHGGVGSQHLRGRDPQRQSDTYIPTKIIRPQHLNSAVDQGAPSGSACDPSSPLHPSIKLKAPSNVRTLRLYRNATSSGNNPRCSLQRAGQQQPVKKTR